MSSWEEGEISRIYKIRPGRKFRGVKLNENCSQIISSQISHLVTYPPPFPGWSLLFDL